MYFFDAFHRMLVDEERLSIPLQNEGVLVHDGEDPLQGGSIHEVHQKLLPHEELFRLLRLFFGLLGLTRFCLGLVWC